LERVLQQACADPGIDVLHLVNEPPWAKFFRPLVVGVWSYFAPNWSLRGLLVHLGLLLKRKTDGVKAALVSTPMETQQAQREAD
jgi:hypothetical protein